MKSKIIVLAGFSSSGKDTIARLIEKEGAHFIVSTTTRPIRDYESEGNPYYFISTEKFISDYTDEEFVEVRTYDTILNGKEETWYYGVRKDEVKDSQVNVCVLDIVGLRGFKEYYGNRVVSIFIDADDEIRRQRNIDRGDYDEKEFNRRLEDDKNRFPEKVILRELDYRIQSSTPEENTKQILDLISARELAEKIMEKI